jgi:hypothetical protein
MLVETVPQMEVGHPRRLVVTGFLWMDVREGRLE